MLTARLQSGIDFSIQLDVSIDIANCATLLVCKIWVAKWYVGRLCCLNLRSYTTGADGFIALEEFLGGQ